MDAVIAPPRTLRDLLRPRGTVVRVGGGGEGVSGPWRLADARAARAYVDAGLMVGKVVVVAG